jgi:hypothetical protein
MRPWLAGWVLVALGVLLSPAGAAAASPVTNTNDQGPGSLRAALASAMDGDTINVPAGHFRITSGPLDVADVVTIAGRGAGKTTLDAAGDSRVMKVAATPGEIVLRDLTVRGGDGDGAGGNGGGIDSGSGLILSRVAVVHNIAGTRSSLGNGGGVSAPFLTIRRSLFAYNTGYNGGALASSDITAIDSTFVYNSAGSTEIGENGDGGAFDDPVTLIDSTVAFNRCFNKRGCGGGVNNLATLKGSLIAGNRAFADNGKPAGSRGNRATPDNCTGRITSRGHNLDSGHDCRLNGPGDISGRKPNLGKLKLNGGQTKTLAIGRRSPAFDAGSAFCSDRDQRGVLRPQGRRCDIGAFELKL